MEKLSDKDELYNIWILIAKARRCLFKAREKELSKYSVTPEQAAVLYILHSLGGKTTRPEIARLTCREFQTVSGVVNRMVKSGLVKLQKNRDSKRGAYVIATNKGKQAYLDSEKRESINNILSFLSEEDRHKLVTTLKEVHERSLEELRQYHAVPFLR
jgi:DNA-binding MarR family transcriptional regulator